MFFEFFELSIQNDSWFHRTHSIYHVQLGYARVCADSDSRLPRAGPPPSGWCWRNVQLLLGQPPGPQCEADAFSTDFALVQC